MRYEPPAINFHLGETPPREPQGGGEHTVRVATVLRPTHPNPFSPRRWGPAPRDAIVSRVSDEE